MEDIGFMIFGIFVAAFMCVFACVAAVIVTRYNKAKKNKKGDYLSPKPKESSETKKDEDPFSAYKTGARPAEKSREKSAEVSPVHANCDHARKPSPYIDIADTYSMNWDSFKSFALKLLTAEYPSARISPYKYRGSPDIQLKTGGKDVDVRLIFTRENAAVDKADFDAAVRDTDDKDEVVDWIMTNGRFTVLQRSSANAKNIKLLDASDMYALMRRCNISAKPE